MEHPHSGHRERLRDRYMQSGIEAFADHELLELLLTYAIPRRDVNAMAHELITRFGSLENVLKADPAALRQVTGIGDSAAIFLHLQHDLMQRILLRRFSGRDGRIHLSTPLKSAQYTHELLCDAPTEKTVLLCLNAQRELICVGSIGDGTIAEASVYPRTAAELVLLQHAHSAILAHNHPSGNPLPSDADHLATKQVAAALGSLGVPLLDHLIVGHGTVYSSTSGQVLSFVGDSLMSCSPDEYLAGRICADAPVLSLVMEPYAEYN